MQKHLLRRLPRLDLATSVGLLKNGCYNFGMITPQLLDYIRQQLATGVSKDEIKKALTTQGWNEQDIREAFSLINTSSTLVPAIPPTGKVHTTLVVQPNNKKKSLVIAGIVTILFLLGAAASYVYLLPIIQKGNPLSFFSQKNISPVACSANETTADKEEGKQRSDLENQIRILSAAIASSTPQDDTHTTLQMYSQLDELQGKYNELTAEIIKRQVASTSAELIASVYTAYCSPQVAVSTAEQSTSTARSLSEQLSQTSFGALACNLENKTYNDSQLPIALLYMGSKLAQAVQFNDSVNFYKCAAEKYYNLTSMYSVAQVYKYGSAELQKSFPDIVVKTEIKPDLKEAYYWITALIHTESAQKTGILDIATQTGWNIIAMLDSLQQDQSLTDDDLRTEEEKAVTFVGKRYPEILETQSSVYDHSLRGGFF